MNPRVEHQPAWLLHSHPWRETSLVLDVFSREHGRVPLVAKGARRPQSQLRGVLMAFQPLLVSWTGKAEVRTLTAAEWRGGQALLGGAGLMCGYYVNELLSRLLPRDDAHPPLFDRYSNLLQGLAQANEPNDLLLRRFELALLRELGYAPTLDVDLDGAPIAPEGAYVFIIEQGLRRMVGSDPTTVGIPGQVLLDLSRDDFTSPLTLVHAKSLMRRLISHLLGSQALESRRIFMELQEL